jgi:uncharacterized protein YjbI with pentapeptide repeats
LVKDATQKGTEFETQTAALYRSAGYDITQNYSISGSDFDLLCRKEVSPQIVVSIAVECKFKSGREKVGPLDVEKFCNKFKYAKDFGITHGVIVCNNGFTPTAHIAAQNSNISLRSSTELEDDLLGFAAKFVVAQRKYQTSDIFREYFSLEGMSHEQGDVADIEGIMLRPSNGGDLSPRRIFLLGDFGAGKTTLVNRANYNLQAQYLRDRQQKVPIVFRLNRLLVENDLRRFIENQLRSELGLDLSYETFLSLMNGGKITLFLDGLDEIESHADEEAKIFNIARLSPLFNSNCDLIITSRPTMFKSKNEMLGFFSYIERHETISSIFDNADLARVDVQSAMQKLRVIVGKSAGETLEADRLANSQVITINPLSKPTVITVLKSKTAILEKSQSMPIDDIIRELFNIYDLSDLMSRPFLLFMVIDVLRIHKIKQIVDQKTTSSAMLYSIYIESYLKRDWEKGRGRQFLTPLERRTFSQCMALSMLYKAGRLSVTLSEILPVLTRVMNERMDLDRRKELETNIQSLTSDILLCAFLRISGEEMFEFVHKSFMEYFSAEYIASVLVQSKENQIISELGYDLNQEILQFIGGLSTAFPRLNNQLISQLAFTLPSGPNVYRKNLAASLLYSNRDSNIELFNVSINSCNFRRKVISRSSFTRVQFQNCGFTEVTISDLQGSDLEFQDCKFLSAKLRDISAHFTFSMTSCERVALTNLQDNSWENVGFSDANIENCKIRLGAGVTVHQSIISDTTISLVNGNTLKNSIGESRIVNSEMVQSRDAVSLGEEIVLLKNPQIELSRCELQAVMFTYPVLHLDLWSLENMDSSSGVFLTSVSELSKEARNSAVLKPASANVNFALSPFFRLYSERGNRLLIVNLDSDESTQMLQRLIEYAETTDPVVVVRTLIDNKDWLPHKR